MSRHKSLRSQLYRAARDLGDVEAVTKGPKAIEKRFARRVVYRHVYRWTAKGLRRIGL